MKTVTSSCQRVISFFFSYELRNSPAHRHLITDIEKEMK